MNQYIHKRTFEFIVFRGDPEVPRYRKQQEWSILNVIHLDSFREYFYLKITMFRNFCLISEIRTSLLLVPAV